MNPKNKYQLFLVSIPIPSILHCRFLVPDSTQKILTEIWHHFWVKGSRKKYFQFSWWPSEIPTNLSGQFSLSGQIFLHWAAATLKAIVEFWNIFSRPLFTIIFKPKMVSNLPKNFVCIVWHQRPTMQCYTYVVYSYHSNKWTCQWNSELLTAFWINFEFEWKTLKRFSDYQCCFLM